MGIIDGKLLYCCGVSEVNMDRIISTLDTTTVRFINASIIPLHMILVAQL